MATSDLIERGQGPFRPPKDITRKPRSGPPRLDGAWYATSYEGVGEGTVTWVMPKVGSDRIPTDAELELRADQNRERSGRRRRKNLERYCVKNKLTRQWTLSVDWSDRPEARFDRDTVVSMAEDYFRRLRKLVGAELPYVYVLEIHPGGNGYHIHVALPALFIGKHAMQKTWGHGVVWYSDRKDGRKLGQRALARSNASYLAKYLGKDVGGVGKGVHAYEVAQGFQARKVSRRCSSLTAAVAFIRSENGNAQPVKVSCSDDWGERYDGPPCYVFTFD